MDGPSAHESLDEMLAELKELRARLSQLETLAWDLKRSSPRSAAPPPPPVALVPVEEVEPDHAPAKFPAPKLPPPEKAPATAAGEPDRSAASVSAAEKPAESHAPAANAPVP